MKMFQIHEDDLVSLERLLPQISEKLINVLDNPLRVKIRQIQSILLNVRWNYGPPSEIEPISAD